MEDMEEKNYRAMVMEDIFGTSGEDDGDDENDFEVDGHENEDMETRDIEEGPKKGDMFSTVESLLQFFQEHAKLKGFGVARRSAHKEKDGEYKYVLISCDRGRNTNCQKQSKRINCPARVNAIKRDFGFWEVSKVVSTHNHELHPEMSCLMTAHRNVSVQLKRQLEANDIAGVRPCKNIRMLEVQAGGPQNLGCLAKDCRNFIESRRRLRLGIGDSEAIRKLFVTMQQKDRDFFHLMDVDDEGRLTNVLWIHPHGRVAYEEFHDVITFDTTYLVNRYNMPFATFVGVNHHGHSMLLGCALVTHEDTRSFEWVFMNWLEAMGNVHPYAILTDQCDSIKAAIRKVMPNTIHRFCLWHIMSKVPQKFANMAEYANVVKEFNDVVYDSLTIEMFEINWNEFITRNRLENHDWLLSLYSQRESWASVFLNNTFWAGMVSTQRSEGMHAFFDGYITRMSTLKQFVEQYEIAITDKIQKEFISDFESKNKVVKCISLFDWERQFQHVYTNSMFKLVQDEIKRVWYCHFVPSDEEEVRAQENVDGVEKLKVLERSIVNNWYRKEFLYTVEYRAHGQYLSCNCKKFEFKGIPCCHIFKIMSMRDLREINERYILRRWRKDVFRKHSIIFFRGGYPHMTEEYKKYQEVERDVHDCMNLCMDNVPKMEYVKMRLKVIVSELKNWNDEMENMVNNEVEDNMVEHPSINVDIGTSGTPILDPNVIRPRGRPRSTRFRSNSESGRGRGRGRGHGRGRGRGEEIDTNTPVIATQDNLV